MLKKAQLAAALICGLVAGAGGQQIISPVSTTARVFNLRLGADGSLAVGVTVQPNKGLPFGREIVWKDGHAFLDGEPLESVQVSEVGKAAVAFRDVSDKNSTAIAAILNKP